jgi:hypothetical protein
MVTCGQRWATHDLLSDLCQLDTTPLRSNVALQKQNRMKTEVPKAVKWALKARHSTFSKPLSTVALNGAKHISVEAGPPLGKRNESTAKLKVHASGARHKY